MKTSSCTVRTILAGTVAWLAALTIGRAALSHPGGQADLAVTGITAPASVRSGQRIKLIIHLRNQSPAKVTGCSVSVEVGKSPHQIRGVSLAAGQSERIDIEGIVTGKGVCQVTARIVPPAGVSDPNPINNQASARMRVAAAASGTRSSSDPPLEEVTFVFGHVGLSKAGSKK
jgi:hypothetical protein